MFFRTTPARRRRMVLAIGGVIMLFMACPVFAAGGAEVDELRQEIERLRRRDEESRKKLEELERKVDATSRDAGDTAKPAADPQAALDAALGEGPEATSAKSDWLSARAGSATLRLVDISFDVLTAAGTSTEPTDEIQNLQGGGHDPNRRGFTLQQGEFSLSGAVDPYFTAEAHIVFIPEGVELEEAYFTSTSLPYGLQLKGGHYLTEFGLMNPTHPHAWDWLDQPVISGRLFGGDGTRAPGARLSWLTPLPWFSEVQFGVQNANEGETTHSYLGSEVGGRPTIDRSVHSAKDLLYLMRWNHSLNLTSDLTAMFGVSGLYGPNASGHDGETWIYGADLKVRWRPANNFRGWPFVIWQTEAMKRDYTADWYVASTTASASTAASTSDCFCHAGHCHGDCSAEPPTDGAVTTDLPATILRDAGVYSQLLFGFSYGWAAGLRYEFAGGSGASVIDGTLGSRQDDPTRDDRHRLSPLVVWQPSEFSRFRLQYNYDNAQHLAGRDAHSIWVGAELLYGAHPAHKY